MDCFEVVYSKKAKEDIHKLYEFIVFEYKAPITAFSYVQGLFDEIRNYLIVLNPILFKPKKYFNNTGRMSEK